MIRKIRLALAALFFIGISLLFICPTGSLQSHLQWMVKVQFWPALLQFSTYSLAVVACIILLTLLFGRIYCSVICPLGILQDVIARIGRIKRKFPYKYSSEKKWLRYPILILMIAAIPFGLSSLLAPYSAFGRIATSIFHTGTVMGTTLAIAAVTLAVVGVLAAMGGRTYCNTICPVGTLLSLFARFSRLKMVIDTTKCKNCQKCARRCKAGCIDVKNHTIDYSRCVVCGNCIGECAHKAITYGHKPTIEKEISIIKEKKEAEGVNRRSFLLTTALATTSALVANAQSKADEAVAAIEGKKAPERKKPILPPGAGSIEIMSKKCTACQLCVSACPNDILRPSTSLDHFMQPVISYANGYCRPECHACSDVCPAGAIVSVGKDKAFTKIGTAHVLVDNCLSAQGEVSCGNCSRHCPVGAIEMEFVPLDPDDEYSMEVEVPKVNESRCIGCGACEYLCPSKPLSAIYVEGISE